MLDLRPIVVWSVGVLVFVDESEWPRPKDPSGFTVWGAIAIHPSRSREFFREVYQLERKFWKVEEPYEFEIKGRLLLNKTAVTSPKKREFCEELMSLCKLNGVRAFAAVCSRIQAIVALDSQDEKTDTARASVKTPFFVSSKATLGIQLADLVAYALAQQNQGRTDIKDICDRVRELGEDHDLGGDRGLSGGAPRLDLFAVAQAAQRVPWDHVLQARLEDVAVPEEQVLYRGITRLVPGSASAQLAAVVLRRRVARHVPCWAPGCRSQKNTSMRHTFFVMPMK